MNTVSEMYPEFAAEPSYGPSDYTPIIKAIGTPLVRVDDRDYQGDTRVLFAPKDGQYGFLVIGWGSCSGCDALQACSSIADVQKLADEIEASCVWLDREAMIAKLTTWESTEGQHWWHAEEGKRFVAEALAALKGTSE